MFDRKFGYLLLIAIAAGLGLLAGRKLFLSGDPEAAAPHYPPLQAVVAYPQPRALPAFSLRQSDGTQLTSGELNGHWTLVFLGFTACPDVCPTTLAQLAQAQKQWQALPDSTRPRVLFVSVDPERDSATRIGEYAHGFHPDTLAATADVPTLEEFAKSLGFVFMKVPGPHFEENPDDYTMDHSAGIAVLDPRGRLAGLIRPPLQPAAIAADLTTLTQAGAR
ncbi:MAG: SCO family protein [Pseudoxanthomonas sp.]